MGHYIHPLLKVVRGCSAPPFFSRKIKKKFTFLDYSIYFRLQLFVYFKINNIQYQGILCRANLEFGYDNIVIAIAIKCCDTRLKSVMVQQMHLLYAVEL